MLLQGAVGNALLNSFEDTLEFTANCSYCVALYNYDKTNPNDMTLKWERLESYYFTVVIMKFCLFRSGDVVELINTASNDWWKGCIGEMKGYFPASYVQVGLTLSLHL